MSEILYWSSVSVPRLKIGFSFIPNADILVLYFFSEELDV